MSATLVERAFQQVRIERLSHKVVDSQPSVRSEPLELFHGLFVKADLGDRHEPMGPIRCGDALLRDRHAVAGA